MRASSILVAMISIALLINPPASRAAITPIANSSAIAPEDSLTSDDLEIMRIVSLRRCGGEKIVMQRPGKYKFMALVVESTTTLHDDPERLMIVTSQDPAGQAFVKREQDKLDKQFRRDHPFAFTSDTLYAKMVIRNNKPFIFPTPRATADFILYGTDHLSDAKRMLELPFFSTRFMVWRPGYSADGRKALIKSLNYDAPLAYDYYLNYLEKEKRGWVLKKVSHLLGG